MKIAYLYGIKFLWNRLHLYRVFHCMRNVKMLTVIISGSLLCFNMYDPLVIFTITMLLDS